MNEGKKIMYWEVKIPNKSETFFIRDEAEARAFAVSDFVKTYYGSDGEVIKHACTVFDTGKNAEENSVAGIREAALAKLDTNERRALQIA